MLDETTGRRTTTPKPTFQGLTPGSVLGLPSGPIVVPGFSTDASGKIVTSANVAQVQQQAETATAARNSNAAVDSSPDWYKAFFAQYNLPGDVQGQVVDFLRRYAADPNTGVALAQQYLRTTPWFQTTFPGFSEGVRAGAFTNETGYRDYVNGLNQVYGQYFDRSVSGNEVTAALTRGVAPSRVAAEFQGDVIARTNAGDYQQLAGAFGEGQLSEPDLQAYGREQAGIDTPQGQRVQRVLERAKQRAQAIFSGNVATPGLSLAGGRLSAPGLAGRGATDVSA